jgi:histidinol-phosphate aminotransferase
MASLEIGHRDPADCGSARLVVRRAAMVYLGESAPMVENRARAQVERRVDLEMICPYEPGKPIDEVRRELGLTRITKLASNENPLGPSPRVVDTLNRSNLELHQYPDYDGYYLRTALAAKLGVAYDELVLGAGSAEIMRLVADGYLERGDESLVADICFPVYENVTRIAGATPVAVPLDSELRCDLQRLLEAVTPRTRVVFIASPNNPTGCAIPTADLTAFVERLPPTVLCVLDLAYSEYVEPSPDQDLLGLMRRFPNVVLLRTFSKVYGLAGLRIGYGIACADVASWLSRTRIPFNTSTAAQVAARVALEDQEHVERAVALNRAMRDLLAAESPSFGFRAHPSWGNFVLLEGPRDSQTVFQHLVRRGIVVRPMRHPRLASCIRVTTGTEEQTREFLGAMREFMAGGA